MWIHPNRGLCPVECHSMYDKIGSSMHKMMKKGVGFNVITFFILCDILLRYMLLESRSMYKWVQSPLKPLVLNKTIYCRKK